MAITFAKIFYEYVKFGHDILLFHTNIRQLSNRNIVGWLYGLREEVAIFLDLQQKPGFHGKFQSESFSLSHAYLVDIFEELNALDLKL